jgi:hypothetical protein
MQVGKRYKLKYSGHQFNHWQDEEIGESQNYTHSDILNFKRQERKKGRQ